MCYYGRVGSIGEHSAADRKGPGIITKHVMHLTPGVAHGFPKGLRNFVSYAQKDPRFLFERNGVQPQGFWSLVSAIYGSMLP